MGLLGMMTLLLVFGYGCLGTILKGKYFKYSEGFGGYLFRYGTYTLSTLLDRQIVAMDCTHLRIAIVV